MKLYLHDITKPQYVALAACIVLFFPAIAFATQSTNYPPQLTMAGATCDRNYVQSYINDVIVVIPSASLLSQGAIKLNNDLTTLQGYVTSGDNAGFMSFVKGTYMPDMKSTWVDVGDTIKAANLSEDQKTTLISEHKKLWSTYFSCLTSQPNQ